MKPKLLIAVLLFSLAGFAQVQPLENAASRASLNTVAASIHSELKGHGERVMGKDVYYWDTRLEKIDADCRAEFSVRLTDKRGEPIVHVDDISFSLGALDPYGIGIQKHFLQIPCAERQQCIFSTSTCTHTSADGIVTDCTTASQNWADTFTLQFDGDAESAQRLQQAFRLAAETCRRPSRVTF